ncbi:LuxR family transcriptional regulator [soil metagenome]
MAKLPQGTVTLVFTDIEGSTRLLTSLGSRYEAVLAEHRKLLRDAFQSHAGTEVDTQGDAFFYAFAKSRDAVAAAAEAQRALASHDFGSDVQLKVRMGIHTGEPTLTQEGYVGSDVHLGARICAAAWGGQIVVSSPTAALLSSGLEEVTLRPLGHHALKDIDERVELYQAVAAGLTQDFPPLRTVGSQPTNLPPRLAPLIGRERELASLAELFSSPETTVVTIVGPGGTGKTSVAAALGAQVLSSFPDGVFFVDLSPLNDAALVIPALAQALSLKEAPGRTLQQSLTEHLSSKDMLVILDNFEHVIEAAPEVSSLLTGAPGLRVVVTSREALRIEGERVVSLAPLDVPSADQDDPDEVARSAAVSLFTERARAVKADFSLTKDNAPDVAAICRRLDGLPLAIELAAARVTLLSPSSLLARLDRGLKVLTSGRRDASARQRTLRGAIEWSYGLLTEYEQMLFRRLGVFAGGWSPKAAERVCDRGDLDIEVWDGLASLVDKSLVRVVEGEQERFSMLETIREFASEKLEESGEAEGIRWAQAEFFGTLMEEAEQHLIGPAQKQWLDRLEQEQSNIRTALDWTSTRDTRLLLQLTSTSWRFWYSRGHLTEGQQRLEYALRAADHANSRWTAKALRALAVFLERKGNYDKAHTAAEESLAIYRGLGDETGASDALEALAIVAENRGDFISAETYFRESLRICEDAGDKRGAAFVANNLADLAMNQGASEVAKAVFEDNLHRFQDLHDDEGVAWTSVNLAVAVRKTDPHRAYLLLKEGLFLAHSLGHRELIADCFEGLASVMIDRRPLLALRLLTKAARLYEETGIRLEGTERAMYDETVSRLHHAVSEAQWAVVATGHSPRVDELMAELDATFS